MLGFSVITVASMLIILYPSFLTFELIFSRKNLLSIFLNSSELSKYFPKSPLPDAPKSASHIACISMSPSE